MELTALQYRILNYLRKRSGNTHTPNSLIQPLGIKTRVELDEAINSLSASKLINRSMSDLSINVAGIEEIDKINDILRDEASEFIYDDYDLAVLSFLSKNEWGIKLEEFPEIFKTENPTIGTGNESDDYLLLKYLYPKRTLIEEKNGEYRLTTEGNRTLKDKYKRTRRPKASASLETNLNMITFSPKIFSVPNKLPNKRLVAVMFPFSHANTFEVVKSACLELNLECKKANDIWENSTFIQDIFDLIFTCEVVIADFTGRNANVFYEVGIAHTLGKTVIPITQSIDDIPSDLLHHRVLKYLPNTEGFNEMKIELKSRLNTLIV